MSSPELVIIAGPNGSGKSSLTRDEILAAHRIEFPKQYINADDIAKMFRETMPNVTQEERERAAFREARRLRQTFRDNGQPFAFETVFSHPSTLLDMRKCREAGFAITLLFVCTANPEINVNRVIGRVVEGGHHVNADKIRSRYTRTMRLLPRIVEEATTVLVFDSTEEKQTRLCFRRGRYTITDDLPEYLVTALTSPLEVRERERSELAQYFPTAQKPDEEAGEYTGSIVWSGAYYVVQESESGMVAHDLLLFDTFPQVEGIITVLYKDNAATLTR